MPRGEIFRQRTAHAAVAVVDPAAVSPGRLTITIGATLPVVVATPGRLNGSPHMASSAATTYGNPTGSTPAIAEFTAASSTVHSRRFGAITPMTSDAPYGVASSSARTASSVGGRPGARRSTPRGGRAR